MTEPTTSDTDTLAHSRWIRARNLALQYVGIGWFLTQVFAVMARRFGWPEAVGDWLIIVLGAGFVATLAMAMLVGRRSVRRGPTRLGLRLAAVMALAAVAVWLMRGGPSSTRGGAAGMVSESRGLFSSSTGVDGFFVVHPQEPLIHTGIAVRRGQTITAWGEGRINIALARLVEAVEVGDAVAYEWVGPEGEVDARGQPVIRRDRARPGRERCLVHGAYPYGALLLTITATDRPTPATARSLAADREIFAIGNHLEVTAPTGGYLTLGVNDVYLDREECDPEELAAGREPGSFFRDNVGFFSARLRIR